MMDIKTIRKELKDKTGYNNRQVAVKISNTMDTVIIFTIKTAGVVYEKIKDFADKYDNISRCGVTGEVLNGGNTYIIIHKFE